MTTAEVNLEHEDLLEPVQKLTRDLREAARVMTRGEARYLVDLYYAVQGYPNALIQWALGNFLVTERGCRSALDAYTETTVPGRWLKSVHGIGPVIAAGLLAHIEIEKAPTVGHIWRFAGLDPTVKWEKGRKRPWNAALKVVCWKAGKSFVMLRASESDVYGKLYEQRKAYETAKNEAGDYAETARRTLEEKKFRADTEAKKCYEAGHLPPGRLDARARRWTVKLFLSHLHQVMYEDHFRQPVPKPWIIEHGGHVDVVPVPNWPM